VHARGFGGFLDRVGVHLGGGLRVVVQAHQLADAVDDDGGFDHAVVGHGAAE